MKRKINKVNEKNSKFLSCIRFYIFFLLLKRSFRFLLFFLFSKYLFFFDDLFILVYFDFYNCELFSPISHFHFNESGNSVGDSGELPAFPSSSSSESLDTFRNVIAAENEAEIYTRIRNLENMHFFNIPPQNNLGDYERLVRDNFDQAINVDHFREILDREYFEIRVLERKGLLQDRLFNLMLGEQNIDSIMRLSPYTNIRTEAYDFLEDKVGPLNSLQHSFQRHLMDGSLNSFIQDINQHGRNSAIYREFYQHFTDEDFRRQNGLPLP